MACVGPHRAAARRKAMIAKADRDDAWWRGAVIYQVYPRSFRDTNGDGVGDLAGIANSMDYIAALGVDAIWICPFFPSPMKDFGYDVADYCDVDPLFGTLADFDRVIATAHRLGLRVIIDQVWSHTSDQHAWFTESRQSRAAGKAEWYVWADPRPDGSPPNNWLSVFGGGAWHWEPRRRQYYLHHFLACQPQLNLRCAPVVSALFKAARFWLDRGVDGFRLDAVDFMLHDPALRDNPPRDLTGLPTPTRPFGMQAHVHDMLHPDLLPLFRKFRGVLRSYPGATTLAEVSSEPGAVERSLIYTDDSGGRLDMAYTLDLMKRPFRADTFARLVAEANGKGNGCLCWAFSNHDVVRAVTRWGSGGDGAALARLLVALLLTLPGSACLYQGDELGLPEAHVPPEAMTDPYGIAFYPAFKGRDGARTPMPWRADAPHAGFSTAAPWLPVAAEHRALAVDRQEATPGSVLHFVRRFLQWRKAHSALRLGGATIHPLAEPLLAIERTNGTERLLAVFNLGSTTASLPRAKLPACAPIDGHGFSSKLLSDSWNLPPHQAFFARVLS